MMNIRTHMGQLMAIIAKVAGLTGSAAIVQHLMDEGYGEAAVNMYSYIDKNGIKYTTVQITASGLDTTTV